MDGAGERGVDGEDELFIALAPVFDDSNVDRSGAGDSHRVCSDNTAADRGGAVTVRQCRSGGNERGARECVSRLVVLGGTVIAGEDASGKWIVVIAGM